MKGPILLVAAGALLIANKVFALEQRTPGVISLSFSSASQHGKRSAPIQAGLTNTPSLYFVTITLGTPPQTLSVQLDTGSSDLIVNAPISTVCTAYPSVCAAGAVYNANASSTYQYIDSTLNIFYVSDGATGDYATDIFSIGGASLTGFEFGIAYNSTLHEGVFGVGYPTSESGNKAYANLPVSLVQQGLIATQAYSIFLNDVSATSGTLLLGGMDTSKYSGSLVNTPFVMGPGDTTVQEFFITANGLSATDANGNPVALAGGSTSFIILLDTGTAQTFLPPTLAASVYNFFGVAQPAGSDLTSIDCSAGLSDTRTLNLALSGQTISIGMRELLLSDGNGGCQFGISAAPAGFPNIAGVTFIRSMYVVYDIDNNQASIAQASYNSASSNIVPITGPISPVLSSSPSSSSTSSQVSTTSTSASSIASSQVSSSGQISTTSSSSTTSTQATSSGLVSTTSSSSSSSTQATSSGQVSTISTSSTSSTQPISSVGVPTTSSSSSGPTNVSPSPLFVYDGCFSTGVSAFAVIGTDPAMTVTLCLSLASNNGYLYAGLYKNTCYGAQTFIPAAASKVPDSQCSIPCPGGSGICGGNPSGSTKRQLTILLSVYQQVKTLSPPSTVGGVTLNTTTNVLVTVNTGVTVYLNIGQPYIQLVSTVYTGICGCAAGLGPLTTTSAITLTYGCSICVPTTIPMTTATQLCSNCGPNGSPATVTVTIPCTACSTPTGSIPIVSTATRSIPAGYTGPLISANGAGTLAANNMVILVVSMLCVYFAMH